MNKADIEAIEARHNNHPEPISMHEVVLILARVPLKDRAALLAALKERDAEIATLTDRAETAERELCGVINPTLEGETDRANKAEAQNAALIAAVEAARIELCALVECPDYPDTLLHQGTMPNDADALCVIRAIEILTEAQGDE